MLIIEAREFAAFHAMRVVLLASRVTVEPTSIVELTRHLTRGVRVKKSEASAAVQPTTNLKRDFLRMITATADEQGRPRAELIDDFRVIGGGDEEASGAPSIGRVAWALLSQIDCGGWGDCAGARRESAGGAETREAANRTRACLRIYRDECAEHSCCVLPDGCWQSLSPFVATSLPRQALWGAVA
jgi:hypothetical protein